MKREPRKLSQNGWPQIAMMGAGAVGCYFGGMLARTGAPAVLIGRKQLVDTVNRDGLFLDSIKFQEKIALTATTDVRNVCDAEIVLFCVKTPDTETAAKELKPHLSPGAVVLSLQNGVDNVERIRKASGIEALPAVVYVAVEMVAPGRIKHTGRGDLIIGDFAKSRKNKLNHLAALFERAGIPCRISENIEADLWTKMIMNCAYNAISALGRARYGRMVKNTGTRDLMQKTVEEVAAVAKAVGVKLPVENLAWNRKENGLLEAVFKLGEAMENATSSTAQDLARGKKTEIDSLNGYIARLGKELGVPTPVNQTLYTLVKLLEEKDEQQ